MVTTVQPDLVHIVILDVSGVYAQIHDQGYFKKDSLDSIFREYNDETHWRVITLS